MRVLVTGATGFIGFHVASALVASGHEVFAGVRGRTSRDLPSGVGAVTLDLEDAPLVSTILQQVRPDLIVHLCE